MPCQIKGVEKFQSSIIPALKKGAASATGFIFSKRLEILPAALFKITVLNN